MSAVADERHRHVRFFAAGHDGALAGFERRVIAANAEAGRTRLAPDVVDAISALFS